MHLPETWLGLTALVLLAAALTGGALTAFFLLTDRNAPMDLGLVHGRTGVVGVVLLMVAVVSGREAGADVGPALGLLVLTVMGGATLYYLVRRKGVLSLPVILAHGALAVAALATLVVGLPV